MNVKTYDFKKINQLIKDSDPYLQKYIKSLKKIIEMQEGTIQKAILKIRKLSSGEWGEDE